MKHDIDLSEYSLRTDLTLELIEDKNIDGIRITKKKINDIEISNILVSRKGSQIINKKPGKYITIEFNDITDEVVRENVSNIFVKELKKILRIKDKMEHILVVGLGNENSTPDSLGPLSINQVIVTNHLYEIGIVDDTYQRISAFNPSVMGKTGIETSDMLLNLVSLLKPDKILVIDSLASSSVERLNKTIQMTDTGIHPGSGIGNKRKEISKEIFGIPVIAIGIPTVVDAVTIVSDTLNFLTQHYVYMKKNINNPKLKLMTSINYLNEEIHINNDDKSKLLGLIGTLNEGEVKNLIYDVLTPVGYNLIVTPKEIDFTIKELSEVISKGLNKVFHNR